MNIESILSRKLILSVFLFFVATLAMGREIITETQWQWVIMATVVSYVTGSALQNSKDTSSIPHIRMWGIRIRSLFSRDFVVSISTVIIATVLLFRGNITGDVWFAVCTAIAGVYNIANAASKSER